MLSGGDVSSTSSERKRKFGTVDGGGLHPAYPYGGGESGRSTDRGRLVWRLVIDHVASSWARSVVSLTTFDEGGSKQPACTGIVFHHTKSRTYIVTSTSLFRSSHDERVIFRREAKVRLPNNKVVKAIPVFHGSKENLSVVSVLPKGVPLRAATCLDHHMQQLEPDSQIVSIRRSFDSGKLMTTAGMLAGDPMGAYLEEAAAEGLLIDILGNIVGLNFYDKEGTTFIPRSTILEFLAGFQEARAKIKAKADLRSKLNLELEGRAIKMKARSPAYMSWSLAHRSCLEGSSTMEKKQSACRYCDPKGKSAPGDRIKRLFPGPSWPADGDSASKEAARNWLRSRGYPFPVLHDGGMHLVCDFEEEFGEDIWSKLTEHVASDMSQSVVALASFSGDERYFACTGIVIGCNEHTTRVLTSASLVRNSDDEAKVADNLKIEVCLPDNEHATGTLQHYNLRYNIAIISTMGSRCTQTMQNFDQLLTEPCGDVVAVGRLFESGKLTATGGTLIDKPSELDCKQLMMSTCKITKAGIGGPLIDRDGNFIGMDFYGLEETPYLPRNLVLEVLRSFDAKPDATTDMIQDHETNRWPVPNPFWCYPVWHIYMGEGFDHDDLGPKWM